MVLADTEHSLGKAGLKIKDLPVKMKTLSGEKGGLWWQPSLVSISIQSFFLSLTHFHLYVFFTEESVGGMKRKTSFTTLE